MDRGDDPRGLGDLIRWGTIASVDLAAATCTVTAGDLTSGPIRWIEMRAGRTRTWSPPSKDEQVLLICADGELAAGVALRGIRSSAYPAAGDSLRELIEFDDGAVVAYDPQAHALDVVLPAGATARLVADGGVRIEGDVEITGRLAVSQDVAADGDVVSKGISLADHLHKQVKAGTDNSGPPLP
ncbi:phage baseplate assembly protein V [Sphingomonas sp. PR090111-T3T-6A]|uniref:phage baseplate assembly protein V n=1 Tax=Sphingomonas sp. PR090111-T3T-6A TaxID=685778 RepID=UPI0003749FFC|nr:phage baseplate assembly protein V [Sphingomonas sp. PR090111-T3T-6A]